MGGGAGRLLHRPHAFEIVVSADFGTEDVNNYIARIDEHPIAGCQPVDRTRAVARFLQSPCKMLGNRAYVTLRTAIGDDDGIGERRTAFEVDRYDVFGFVVVEGNQDAGEERGLLGLGCAMGRDFRRRLGGAGLTRGNAILRFRFAR
jgi:hypothetical protein